MPQRGFKDEGNVSNFNQTGASRGSIADTSLGTALKGVGDFIDKGVKGVEDVVQSVIRSDAQEEVNRLDEELGVNDLTEINSDPEIDNVDQLPKGLRTSSANLSKLQGAFEQGGINETVYFARLHSTVRQLRARFPGHIEQIDRIVSEVTSSPAANQLRSQIFAAQNVANTGARSAFDKTHNKILTDSKHLSEARLSEYLTNPNAQLQKELLLEIATSKRQDLTIERNKNLIDINKDKARRASRTIATTVVDQEIQRALQGQDGFLNEIQKRIDDGDISAEDQTVIPELLGQLELQIQKRITEALNDGTVGPDGVSLTSIIGDEGLKNALEIAKRTLAPYQEAFVNPKGGKLSHEMRQAKLLVDQAELKFLTTNGGMGAKLNALKKNLPPEAFLLLTQNGEFKNALSETAAVVMMADLFSPDENKSMTEARTNVENATDESVTAESMVALHRSIQETFRNKESRDEDVVNLSDSVFGSKNQDYITKNFSTPEDRERVFETLTHPDVAKRISSLGEKHQRQYKAFILANAGRFLRDDVATLVDTQQSNDIVSIEFDPKTLRFKMINDPTKNVQPQIGLPFGPSIGDISLLSDFSESRPTQKVVEKLNRFLSKTKNIYKELGEDDAQIALELQGMLQLAGLNLDPENRKGGLVFQLFDAVKGFLSSGETSKDNKSVGGEEDTNPRGGSQERHTERFHSP